MGSIKQNKQQEKVYSLSNQEWDFLKYLDLLTQFSTLRDKMFSGFLYHICNVRLGYPKDVNLVFEMDLKSEQQELKVREIDNATVQKALKAAQASAT